MRPTPIPLTSSRYAMTTTSTIAAGASTAHPQPHHFKVGGGNGHADSLLSPLIQRAFAADREYARYGHTPASADPHSLQNFIFSADAAGADPAVIFPRLR